MRKGSYDGDKIVHFKKGTLDEVIMFFADVESTTSVLERMEVNAMTFVHFRNFGSRVVEQPTLREVKRGLFGRIFTADIWLNNTLKDGQIKIAWNKIEAVDTKPVPPSAPEGGLD